MRERLKEINKGKTKNKRIPTGENEGKKTK
jgi:hypothetical protein